MENRNRFIGEIRSQRKRLDELISLLEEKKPGPGDYRLLEDTVESVEKSLHQIRALSVEEFVREYLWGRDISKSA